MTHTSEFHGKKIVPPDAVDKPFKGPSKELRAIARPRAVELMKEKNTSFRHVSRLLFREFGWRFTDATVRNWLREDLKKEE